MAHCSSCGREIIWAQHAQTGSGMPIEAQVSDRGNVEVTYEGQGLTYRVREAKDGEELHTSHFATCPNAARHRKR